MFFIDRHVIVNMTLRDRTFVRGEMKNVTDVAKERIVTDICVAKKPLV